MAPVNCIQFSYLGTTRYVICDLDTRYEEMQGLVAKTFKLPEEFIEAIQFTDGKGYLFNKALFEYFLILFPQPQQKFFVRLECSKIIENRIASKQGGNNKKNMMNKRKRCDIDDTDADTYAAPVRRQNCFIGMLPGSDDEIKTPDASEVNSQRQKRMRLTKSNKMPMRKCIKPPQPKRALRI